MSNPFLVLKTLEKVSNPNSIHGIYPYRGKISAIDAMNIISQFPSKGTLLDPFCGSGTIIYEAKKHGLKTIGVDNNPLAVQIAKAKIYEKKDNILEECESLISKAKADFFNNRFNCMEEKPAKSFHKDTSNEIMCLKNYFDDMDDYLKAIFFGAIALAARGCNGYKWTSSTVGKNIEPKVYIDFFEKFYSKAKKHLKFLCSPETPNSEIIYGDSRHLSDYIEAKSIDYIFTSPPYFDGLDYTAYYGKLIYEIFKIDRKEIKQNLIQYVDSYRKDMELVLEEIDKITTDNALIVFVVGDKKIRNKLINGGEFFNNIKEASYIVERSYSGSSSQVFDVLNNTKRKEQIVVWDKKNGIIIKHDRN